MRTILNKPYHRRVLQSLLAEEKPNILALLETKVTDQGIQLEYLQKALREAVGPSYSVYLCCSEVRMGYSGTAILYRNDGPQPVRPPVQDFRQFCESIGASEEVLDATWEGRVVRVDYEGFTFVSVYNPNVKTDMFKMDFRVGPGGWDRSFCLLPAVGK